MQKALNGWRVLCTLTLAVLLMTMAATGAMAQTLSGAVLYTLSTDESGASVLEYNVVYTAAVTADTVVTDGTGHELTTLDALSACMGTPDALGMAVTADLTLEEDVLTAIAVTDVAERPVIGISWKKDEIGDDYRGFAQAYARNGATAIFLPQLTDVASAQEALAQVDGVFVTGGEDVNPVLYDEETFPHGSSGWNDARDTSDILLIQQAIALDIPLFGVCRGEQIFNVAMGGSLIQDIPTYLAQKVERGEIDASRAEVIPDEGLYQKVNGEYVRVPCETEHLRMKVDGLVHSGGTGYHELGNSEFMAIEDNAKWLADIAGSKTLELVATAHHQAVNPEKLGEGLTIVAHSSDGIVEGIEYQGNLFALGIQFHPERDALGDSRGVDISQDECNAFLRALVKYASVYKSGK